MFNDSRLLDCVAYGSQFGHQFNTNIQELRSGHESRNATWKMPRYRYSILYANLAEVDHNAVYAAHMACMGSLIPFRFKDWRDFEAFDQVLGTGAGALQTLQLVKQYQFGPLAFERIITKPVAGTVQLFADGVPIAATFDYLKGLAYTSAPLDSTITASFEFDVPVRFASDRLDSEPTARTATSRLRLTSDIELIEVRE